MTEQKQAESPFIYESSTEKNTVSNPEKFQSCSYIIYALRSYKQGTSSFIKTRGILILCQI